MKKKVRVDLRAQASVVVEVECDDYADDYEVCEKAEKLALQKVSGINYSPDWEVEDDGMTFED